MAKYDKNPIPASIEAEQAVLGGLMISPDAIFHLGDKLSESDFHQQSHRLIYRAILDLSESNIPYDVITLGEWLKKNGHDKHTGGTEYLIDLASQTPSAANIVAWAEIVREKSMLRQLMEVSGQIMKSCMGNEGEEARNLVSQAEAAIFQIAETHARGRKLHVNAKEAVKEAYQQIVTRYDNPGKLTGLSTGYSGLDEITNGLQNQDLIIVAARPAIGKTSFAQCIAEHVAIHQGKATALFSMEMSASQLAQRLISSQARVDGNRLRSGKLDEEDWPRMTEAIKRITASKLLIDDTAGLNPQELAFRARRLKREHNIGLIVIDYLQLMTVAGNGRENRATEIAEVSRSLKALAKELDVPIIALSQLNRGVESRNDKRPNMSDLRESGSIEQDADIVIFIYRDDYYVKDSQDKGIAEIIISKHRQGSTGTLKLRFFGEYTRFDELASHQD